MILVSSPEEDIWVVAPEGRVDLSAASSIEESLNGLLGEGRAAIVIDFSGVTYMASAGLRVLILALRRARNIGGDVRLAAASTNVQQVLKMSGMETLFGVHETVPEAISVLKTRSVGPIV
jgi:anti-sigma B factor antagonist